VFSAFMLKNTSKTETNRCTDRFTTTLIGATHKRMVGVLYIIISITMAKGFKTGGRAKGTPNKLTSEVKSKLQLLIDNTIEDLSSTNLSVSHKLKLLEIMLNYCLPKLSHSHIETDNEQKSFRVEYVGSVGEKDNS
jgi:hypothetical protein